MKPFRIEKVSSEVRQIVSDAIRNRLQDPRISPLTSVTRVEISRDLEWANVYVSVFDDQGAQNKTMQALQNASGYIQTLLAKALPIRQCPHLNFRLDESLKKGDQVMQMIDESAKEFAEDADRRDQREQEEPQSNEDSPDEE